MPISGRALRKERRDAEVTQVALAARMGISRETLRQIEKDEEVRAERAGQYLTALMALRGTKQEGSAA